MVGFFSFVLEEYVHYYTNPYDYNLPRTPTSTPPPMHLPPPPPRRKGKGRRKATGRRKAKAVSGVRRRFGRREVKITPLNNLPRTRTRTPPATIIFPGRGPASLRLRNLPRTRTTTTIIFPGRGPAPSSPLPLRAERERASAASDGVSDGGEGKTSPLRSRRPRPDFHHRGHHPLPSGPAVRNRLDRCSRSTPAAQHWGPGLRRHESPRGRTPHCTSSE